MREVEVSAKTLDEAITKGCEQLGVDLDEVDFEVLNEGGVFRKMTVKVSLKTELNESANEKVSEDKTELTTVEEKVEAKEKPENKIHVESGTVEEFEIVGKGKPEKKESKEREIRPVTEFNESCPKFVKTLEFAKEFFALTGDNLSVSTSHNDREFIIEVSGEDVSRLIGKEGKTLAAINTIISSIAISTHTGEPRRVIVDIENYREKRKESLVALAKKKAEFVKETGKVVKLEPMPARERVIVHMALQDVEGIITESEGEEPNRFLVIKPGAR